MTWRRSRPTTEIGWRRLRWRTWGDTTAVARGMFRTLRWVPIGHTDVEQRPFSYRVEVTLARIRMCGDRRRYYTRIATRFLSRAPRSVRRQARPLPTAGCLR